MSRTIVIGTEFTLLHTGERAFLRSFDGKFVTMEFPFRTLKAAQEFRYAAIEFWFYFDFADTPEWTDNYPLFDWIDSPFIAVKTPAKTPKSYNGFATNWYRDALAIFRRKSRYLAMQNAYFSVPDEVFKSLQTQIDTIFQIHPQILLAAVATYYQNSGL